VNARSNRNVCNWRLNALWSVKSWSSAGNAFHALSPACEKQRSPSSPASVALQSSGGMTSDTTSDCRTGLVRDRRMLRIWRRTAKQLDTVLQDTCVLLEASSSRYAEMADRGCRLNEVGACSDRCPWDLMLTSARSAPEDLLFFYSVIFIHKLDIIWNECVIGCKFSQLQYYQILLKSVNIWSSNHKKGWTFLRHSVFTCVGWNICFAVIWHCGFLSVGNGFLR